MNRYRTHFYTRTSAPTPATAANTPQSQPLPGREQEMVANNAGGYAFPVDDWAQLDRFLILGSEGGTYYVSEQKLTVANAETVLRCLQIDGERVVRRAVEVSEGGNAPKNDPALFVLALAASLGDERTRQAALGVLPAVARTGTHLLQFVEFAEGFRGWGRSMRRAVSAWYNQMSPERLAYQVLKYQQRGGWSQHDLLRLAKPVPVDEAHKRIYGYVAGKWTPDLDQAVQSDGVSHALQLFWVYEQVKQAKNEADVIALIEQHGLTWESVPGQWLGSAAVWQALLPHLPTTALMRNLGRMTANGAFKPLSREVETVLAHLADGERIRRARLHPLSILVALKTYQQGHGEKGQLHWDPIAPIVDALDAAYYTAFDQVEPTNKRLMLALDVSGSMGGSLGNLPLSCREGAAAMAMVAARTEPSYVITGFTSAGAGNYDGITRLSISPRQRLDDIVRYTANLRFGATDCAQPMLYALKQKLAVDAFVVYTDSETWHGAVHPVEALRRYRQQTGIPAKLVVVGMVANNVSIADPRDGGMLDVCGFDTAVPQVIGDFIREEH